METKNCSRKKITNLSEEFKYINFTIPNEVVLGQSIGLHDMESQLSQQK